MAAAASLYGDSHMDGHGGHEVPWRDGDALGVSFQRASQSHGAHIVGLVWQVAGFHHAQRGLWYVPLLRLGLAMLAVHFAATVAPLGYVLVAAIHVGKHGLPGVRLAYGGPALAALHTRVSRVLAVAQQVSAAGPATLAAIPRRMQKPRFAARLRRLQLAVACYRVAHFAYVALVLAQVIYISAGGGLGRCAHTGLVLWPAAKVYKAQQENLGPVQGWDSPSLTNLAATCARRDVDSTSSMACNVVGMKTSTDPEPTEDHEEHGLNTARPARQGNNDP
ncbi:hypothetical protein CYMTET_51948 [Cymbomonas tetramitiformis]|uniref:Uncharacterized protein n=1 Tax=Cymbomonas tetramitiformis TaxID=36881 RepID=A0AAE0ERK3_9CHLO|nr:hypothetical protein CYMTET_51948 [Cymbomonas tetramitiformis]